jgi:hypothetical protein
MSNDDTYIEDQPRFTPPPEQPPLPPMPPPPEPPGSGRNWVPLAVVMGLVIVVLCGVAAFGIWRLVQNGDGLFGSDQTETPDSVALTQTALIEDVQDTILATDTAVPAPTDPPEPTAALPTDTTAPTAIPTDTQVPTPSQPTFTASQAIFCRTGPSTIYEERRTMEGGMTRPILGQSVSPVDNVSVWYLVEIDGAQCYVSSGFGTVAGDASDIPTIQPPPTPTPTPSPTPTATPTATPTP